MKEIGVVWCLGSSRKPRQAASSALRAAYSTTVQALSTGTSRSRSFLECSQRLIFFSHLVLPAAQVCLQPSSTTQIVDERRYESELQETPEVRNEF